MSDVLSRLYPPGSSCRYLRREQGGSFEISVVVIRLGISDDAFRSSRESLYVGTTGSMSMYARYVSSGF